MRAAAFIFFGMMSVAGSTGASAADLRATQPGHFAVLRGSITAEREVVVSRYFIINVERNGTLVRTLECDAEQCTDGDWIHGLLESRLRRPGGDVWLSVDYVGDVEAALSKRQPGSRHEFAISRKGDNAEVQQGTVSLAFGGIDQRDGEKFLPVTILDHYPNGDVVAAAGEYRTTDGELLRFSYRDPSQKRQGTFVLESSGDFVASDWRQQIDSCIASKPRNESDLCACGIAELAAACASQIQKIEE